MGEHHDAPLAKAALCMAAAVRGGDVAGVIFHSDKGGEYTGHVFALACDALEVTQLNRPGSDGGSGYWFPTLAGSAGWAA